ncbi:FAD-dependent oxidoreductase [candidate division KSB1 bacterium]|nr:FAD-dependent oxidoreductase [candidate division KSB1 bacterium]
MNEQGIVVLGGGLSGLGAAYRLNQDGIKATIFEKEDQAGGICRTINKDDFLFDIGPHIIFSPPAQIKELVASLIDNSEVYCHNSMLYHSQIKGNYIRAPYQAHLYGLPAKEIIISLIDYGLSKFRDEKKASNYADFFRSVLGNRIFKNFFLPYDQKRLRYTPYLLDAEWVKHRVTRPNFFELVRGSLRDTGSSMDENAEFQYPSRGGIQSFINALANRLSFNQLQLNKEVVSIHPRIKKIKFSDGTSSHYSQILSSLPLPEVINMMEGIPGEIREIANREIQYTSGYVINLGVKRHPVSPFRIIRYHEPDILFYRVTIQSNVAPYSAPAGHSILCAEVSYHAERFPLSREEAYLRTVADLKRVGLLEHESEIVTSDVSDLKYCHLIFQCNYEPHLKLVIDFLAHHDIHSFGRWGGWKYLLMGPSILSGIKAADSFLENYKKERKYGLAVA